MPYYAWKARNGEGRVRKGILAAGCLREAGKELEARFPHILQLRPVSPFQRLFLGRQKLTDLDRETFFRKLGLLLQGGASHPAGAPCLGRPWIPRTQGFLPGIGAGAPAWNVPFPSPGPAEKTGWAVGCLVGGSWGKQRTASLSLPAAGSFLSEKAGKSENRSPGLSLPGPGPLLGLGYGSLFLLVARAPFRGSVCFFRAAAGQGIPGAAGLPGFFPEPSSAAPPWGPGPGEPACIPLERERTLAAVLSFGFPAASIFLGNPFPAAPGPAPAGRAAPGPSPAPSFWDPSSRDFPAPGCSAGKSGDCRFFPVGHRPGDAFSVQSPCSGIHGLGRRKRPAAGSFDRSCPYPGPGFPELAEKCQDPLGTGPLGLIGRRIRQSHGPPLVPSV